MTDLATILRQHAARYPAMEPQDGVKLLYQSTFGGGHIVANAETAIARLTAERAGVTMTQKPLLEPIGDHVRLHLDSLEGEGLSSNLLGRLFCLSARRTVGDMDTFRTRLDLLRRLTAEGVFGFDSDALEECLHSYAEAGYPMVSHSEAYRAAYDPAYRVLDGACARLVPVLLALEGKLASGKSPLVLRIDGRCAGGKTTTAALLAELYPRAGVVHMDDFFLPPSLRSPERYAEAGGNIHYERFREEVSEKIGRGAFAYRRFDCSRMDYGEWVEVPESSLYIVEGSYSGNSKLGLSADIGVFCHVDPVTQIERIVARDGEEYRESFETRWIPLEEAYITACRVVEQSNLI
ncbi:MAG: hypothetical protein IKZ21_00640, partial [Clostridia bacterium]|nr:hypothetical protein [Clostridia bacterium]